MDGIPEQTVFFSISVSACITRQCLLAGIQEVPFVISVSLQYHFVWVTWRHKQYFSSYLSGKVYLQAYKKYHLLYLCHCNTMLYGSLEDTSSILVYLCQCSIVLYRIPADTTYKQYDLVYLCQCSIYVMLYGITADTSSTIHLDQCSIMLHRITADASSAILFIYVSALSCCLR